MTPDTKFWIAEGKSRKSVKWRNKEVTWVTFVDKLRTPRRTPETMKQYKVMSKDEKDTLKEMPGAFVGARLSAPRRLVGNVHERTLITLDADYATAKDWDNFTCLYDELAVVAYPTHSSTPESPRMRWILPVSRPMSPEEYPAVARKVASWIGIETMDTSTYELNRLFYYPGVPDDAPYELKEQRGKPVDVDAVLAGYGSDEAWRHCYLWPTGKKETVALVQAQERLGDPREKNGIVGLFCRTYSILDVLEQFLPDVYEETATPGRYTYTAGTTSGGARVYGDYMYSSHGTDPAGGHSQNAFDLVRIHKFGQLDNDVSADTAPNNLPSYKAMLEWANGLPDVRERVVAERTAATDAAFEDMTGAGDDANTVMDSQNDEVDSENDEDDNSWVHQLTLRPKSSEIEPTINNIQLILTNDKRLKGRIANNDFTHRRCAREPLPWAKGRGGVRSWEDSDDAGLRWYLETAWGISNRGAIADALDYITKNITLHPVREYLSGLTWDGVKRVETVLIDYLGADDVPINREIAKRWMVAAVKRVFQPGCKFDTILVLVSPEQGIGKSQFADVLGGDWFQDGLPQIDSKDAKQALRGVWIVEVSEMAATKRAEDEAIKQFFAARSDRYRESYGRYEVVRDRQCVFIGSTNTREFITDNTGGRRFWPVDVHASKADVGPRMNALREVRDQLWAEAYALYRAGHTPTWFDEPEYLAELTAQQARHTQEDEWEGWVRAYLDKPLPDDWDTLSAEERAIGGLGIFLVRKTPWSM